MCLLTQDRRNLFKYTMNYTDKDKPRAARLAYSRKEAAGLLGISEPTLDRLVKRGLIRPSRALRRPLFTEEELKKFLQETKSL